MMNLTVDFDREISALLEYLFGLDRQTDDDFPWAIEYLEELIAEQAMIFTWGALASRQFNASVPRMAFGADDVGFLHALANYHPVTRNSTGGGSLSKHATARGHQPGTFTFSHPRIWLPADDGPKARRYDCWLVFGRLSLPLHRQHIRSRFLRQGNGLPGWWCRRDNPALRYSVKKGGSAKLTITDECQGWSGDIW
jgi:hypothetical protein